MDDLASTDAYYATGLELNQKTLKDAYASEIGVELNRKDQKKTGDTDLNRTRMVRECSAPIAGVEPSITRRESWIPNLNDELQEAEGYMTREEFTQLCEANPSRLFDHISELACGLQDQRDDLQNQVQTKQMQIEALIAERDEYKDAFARQCLRSQDDSTRGTPPPEQQRRSAKLPDPELLTDGKSPRFEDWLSRMKGKLAGNADHFPTERLRIAYVESRTGDKAAKHLAPRMRDDAPNKFRVASEMFKHLESIFLDPNRQSNARRKFRALQMKPSDHYHDFLTEFLYLAGEANIPEAEFKEELYDRLTYKLKEMMVFYRQDKSTFDEFSTHCSYAANSLQSIAESRSQNKSSEKPITTTPRAEKRQEENTRTSVTVDTAPSQRRSYPTHFTAEQHELMKTGSCFNCKAPGHLGRNCPLKKRAATLKEIEGDDANVARNELSGKGLP